MRPYTHVCARCALRFEGVRFEGGSTCPKCADTRHVFDGGDHGAQEKARASLRTFASWRKLRLRIDEIFTGARAMWGVALLSLGSGSVMTWMYVTLDARPHVLDLEPCLWVGWASSLRSPSMRSARARC